MAEKGADHVIIVIRMGCPGTGDNMSNISWNILNITSIIIVIVSLCFLMFWIYDFILLARKDPYRIVAQVSRIINFPLRVHIISFGNIRWSVICITLHHVAPWATDDKARAFNLVRVDSMHLRTCKWPTRDPRYCNGVSFTTQCWQFERFI